MNSRAKSPELQAEVSQPPTHSVQAEHSVLGALLLDNAAWDSIADVIAADDFYSFDNRRIFEAITALISNAHMADVITVSEYIDRRGAGELEKIGGLAFLGDLAMNTPSAANIRHYARIVKDRAVLRKLGTTATDIADKAYRPGGRSASEILDEAQEKMFSLTSAEQRAGGFVEMRPILATVAETVDALYNRNDLNDTLGVPTGFTDLDREMSGMGPGDLIILAARPSMGKTALAMNIASNVATMQRPLPVAIFSMEMPKEALGLRLVCANAHLNFHLVRKGRLRDDDWPKFSGTVGAMADAPIHIDETGAISPTELRARCRRLHRECGPLGLVVVDYLQLMGINGLGDTRAGDIGVATRSLKALAKELNCPVLALSQVNRGVESRPNKRPNMSDLRESGDIEQDADVIIFLYRDEVYHDDTPMKGMAEAIIAKQRNGPIGTVKLTWLGEQMRFTNYAHLGPA